MADRINRRNLLMGIATSGIISVAGCSSQPNSNTNPNSSNQSSASNNNTSDSTVFSNITVKSEPPERSFVRVELSSNNSVSQVNLIGPDGTSEGHKSVNTGQTAVEFIIAEVPVSRISVSQSPGEYEIVAIDSNDSELSRETIEFERKVEFEDVSLHRVGEENHPRTFEVQLKNTGDFPVKPGSLIVFGDVLRPMDPDSPYLPTPDIVNQDRQGGNIWPDETVTMRVPQFALWSESSYADLEDRGTCNGQEKTATIQFRTESGLTRRLEVTFTLSGEVLYLGGAGEKGCENGSIISWEETEV